MKKSSVLLLFLLTGCGKPVFVEPLLVKYLIRFEKAIGVSTSEIEVSFGKLPGKVVGRCYDFGSKKIIRIDKNYWNKISDLQREEIMFHELGHCALDLGHDKVKINEKCPRSIMFPQAFSLDCYKTYRNYYIQELKHKNKY